MSLPMNLGPRFSRLFTSTRSLSNNAAVPGLKNGAKVVVAMSGGVDSSVTATLLARQTYDLSAIFMRNWDTRDESGTERGCEWEKDWEDVQQVCRKLDIPCKMVDLSRQYWTRVFEPALDVWRAGETPNPDVACNREIKFGALKEHLHLGTGFLATGHYARLETEADAHKRRVKLRRGVDPIKDQSYWLSSVPEEQFRNVLFPIGHLSKADVREIAKNANLPTATRKESMGICFVGKKRSFSGFLDDYLPPNPGNIVTLDGKLIGRHQGLWRYTIGQNARISGLPRKTFVVDKRVNTNEIVVVDDPNHPTLHRTTIAIRDMHWIWSDHPPSEIFQPSGLQVEVKFRSVMEPTSAIVYARYDPFLTDYLPMVLNPQGTRFVRYHFHETSNRCCSRTDRGGIPGLMVSRRRANRLNVICYRLSMSIYSP